jgi:hypothetical protein
VVIAGYDYPVVNKDRLEHDKRVCHGLFSADDKITIRAASLDREWWTLVHEMLHAINHHYHVQEIMKWDEDQEEIHTTLLGDALFDTLKRNGMI